MCFCIFGTRKPHYDESFGLHSERMPLFFYNEGVIELFGSFVVVNLDEDTFLLDDLEYGILREEGCFNFVSKLFDSEELI